MTCLKVSKTYLTDIVFCNLLQHFYVLYYYIFYCDVIFKGDTSTPRPTPRSTKHHSLSKRDTNSTSLLPWDTDFLSPVPTPATTGSSINQINHYSAAVICMRPFPWFIQLIMKQNKLFLEDVKVDLICGF